MQARYREICRAVLDGVPASNISEKIAPLCVFGIVNTGMVCTLYAGAARSASDATFCVVRLRSQLYSEPRSHLEFFVTLSRVAEFMASTSKDIPSTAPYPLYDMVKEMVEEVKEVAQPQPSATATAAVSAPSGSTTDPSGSGAARRDQAPAPQGGGPAGQAPQGGTKTPGAQPPTPGAGPAFDKAADLLPTPAGIGAFNMSLLPHAWNGREALELLGVNPAEAHLHRRRRDRQQYLFLLPAERLAIKVNLQSDHELTMLERLRHAGVPCVLFPQRWQRLQWGGYVMQMPLLEPMHMPLDIQEALRVVGFTCVVRLPPTVNTRAAYLLLAAGSPVSHRTRASHRHWRATTAWDWCTPTSNRPTFCDRRPRRQSVRLTR